MVLADWYKTEQKNANYSFPQNKPDTPPKQKYDVIVVGAGPAGATAAYFAAKEGLTVLLLERGSYPGAKSCGGANIFAEPTHKLFPNFWEEIHWERILTDQSYWWLTEDSILSVRFQSVRLASAPYNRFSIKRPNLYKWLSDKAVAAGTELLLSHNVSSVIFDKGQAIGVQVSPPQNSYYMANMVILADGVNSLLAEQAGLTPRVSASNISLYAKETIALPASIIEERFNLTPDHGSVVGLFGYPTAGFNGTASIYTFKDSINISVGMPLKYFIQSGLNPNDLLERIKKHPHIRSLISGGITLEYGSTMIPEGGYHAIPELIHPGLLIVGDAGSLVNGTHGINLAMWSGFFAAKAAITAKIHNDFSVKRLALYRTLLDESFIIQNLKATAGAVKLQEDIPYMFDLYSRIANETAYEVAKIYLMPVKAKRKFIFKKLTSMQPITKIVKDVWKILRVIING